MTQGATHNGLERRVATELRVAGRRLEGYAAKFGAEAKIGSFTETIAPGAFGESLRAGKDVLALVDHNPTALLARTSTGTLTLKEDDAGLAFSINVPDTQAGRDVLVLADRGDLGGMSFGFVATRERWDGKRRTLNAIDLREVSVVSAWPAYEGTEIAARSQAAQARAWNLCRLRRYLETV